VDPRGGRVTIVHVGIVMDAAKVTTRARNADPEKRRNPKKKTTKKKMRKMKNKSRN